jgi:hypothetical protein
MKKILFCSFVLQFVFLQLVFAENIERTFRKDAVNNTLALAAKRGDGSEVKIIVHKEELKNNSPIHGYLFPSYLGINEFSLSLVRDVVTVFRVQINGKDILIPHLERLGLCNMETVRFETISREKFKIEIGGGDASEGWRHILFFGLQEGEIMLYRSEHEEGECCSKPTVIEYDPCNDCR